MIKLNLFYKHYREIFGKIRLSKTVQSINYILAECKNNNLSDEKVAYILATAHHESRHRLYRNDFHPIVERGGWNYIIKKYWYNSKVRRWLGNKSPNDAWTFRGRGFVQLTGRDNYKKYNIEDTPNKALEIKTSAFILVNGIVNGKFTGVGLGKYINELQCDFYNARKTINGLDKAEDIANIAKRFLKIIKLSKL